MPEDTSSQTSPGFSLIQPVREHRPLFMVKLGKPYSVAQKIRTYSKVQPMGRLHLPCQCLLFLNGTARLWYENNDGELNSWEKFQEQLKIAFASKDLFVKQAEQELKSRAQKTGERTQSYIQSVLELCLKVNPSMSESDRVSHLMKGIAEDMY
ncbi:hypothetical protein AVEN_155250-1 [Araneus ventricosus]|uniref:Retrotransposon gag domain-containing protein n=1 Tax=Araneus ventricosus TaxID=182803 RepID=A0A4Y2D639_ARAVE|nr:hypothetical protein AVEN_155250-1 [Araneus ventricosus]